MTPGSRPATFTGSRSEGAPRGRWQQRGEWTRGQTPCCGPPSLRDREYLHDGQAEADRSGIMSAMRTAARLVIGLIVVLVSAGSLGSGPPAPFAFTVSTPDPATHLYHVVMRSGDLSGEVVDFAMPVWTPGYYGTFDYAANVRNFSAADGNGQELSWEKVGANIWRVAKGRRPMVRLAYDVLAQNPFVAAAYLDETRGYITPGALFLYVPGQLDRPVTVTVELHPAWSAVATGMDRASAENEWVFAAADFDVLYDSPILMGRLGVAAAVRDQGDPAPLHRATSWASFDRARFAADLKAVVEAGAQIIGDIPYKHYTFLGIGPGRGGIEHPNSAAVAFSGPARHGPRRPDPPAVVPRARVLPPLQREADPPHRAWSVRLRPREPHEHAVGQRGVHDLLRVPDAGSRGAHDAGGGARPDRAGSSRTWRATPAVSSSRPPSRAGSPGARVLLAAAAADCAGRSRTTTRARRSGCCSTSGFGTRPRTRARWTR